MKITPARRPVAVVLVTALVATCVLPWVALAQETASGPVQDRWDEVIFLRKDGQYDEAIRELARIIDDYPDLDRVLQLAYCHLVFTYLLKDDNVGAEEYGRQALERFPRIEADETYFISSVNATFERLRAQMYSSLVIEEPEGARAFLNEEYVGDTPLALDLVRVGEYELVLTKDGYEDYSQMIVIEPGPGQRLSLAMERRRGWQWWAVRAGAAVVTAAALAIGFSGGDEGGAPPPDPPLPGPPAPPAN